MSEEKTYEKLYRETIPSVVSIYVTPQHADHPGPFGAGSGFVYDEGGHVVTNQHVVGLLGHASMPGGSGTITASVVDEVEVRFSEGEWRTGRVVGTDAHTDLAVIRVGDLPDYARPLPVASENPSPGQRVAALGNPMGLDGTITTGIVSGVNRSTLTGSGFTIPDTVQTDAAINPGNSGGPLVTLDGEVVGVNRAKQGDNIGFAVSPAIVTRVVPDLIRNGVYRHSYLKIRTIDVSPTIADANDLDEPTGVLVVDVSLGPASGALIGCHGNRVVREREVPVGGDVIVGVNGRPVRSHEELMRYLITDTRPDERLEVELIRDGERLTEYVTLGERPRLESDGRSRRIPLG